MEKDSVVPAYIAISEDRDTLLFKPLPGFEQDESWQKLRHCAFAGARRNHNFPGSFYPIIKTTNPNDARRHLNIISQPESETE